MDNDQKQFLEHLKNLQETLSYDWMAYWFKYSAFESWQFWVNGAFLIIPLVVLYFSIERKRALLIGFFGFNVHAWFTYIDVIGKNFGYWSYPYQVIPIMSVSFGLDVSLIPVLFMLVYQWVLKKEKNYYMYAGLLSAFLSFVFKPILVSLNLFQLHKGTNYFWLFLAYIAVFLVSKWLTNIFIYFEKMGKE